MLISGYSSVTQTLIGITFNNTNITITHIIFCYWGPTKAIHICSCCRRCVIFLITIIIFIIMNAIMIIPGPTCFGIIRVWPTIESATSNSSIDKILIQYPICWKMREWGTYVNNVSAITGRDHHIWLFHQNQYDGRVDDVPPRKSAIQCKNQNGYIWRKHSTANSSVVSVLVCSSLPLYTNTFRCIYILGEHGTYLFLALPW